MRNVTPATVKSYAQQSPEVRARFDRLKARDVILDVRGLNKIFISKAGSTVAPTPSAH